jgi:hypothetical protein
LQLRTTVRNGSNAGTGALLLRLNADSGANYSYHLLEGNGSSITSAAGTSQNQAAIGWVPHNSSPAQGFSSTVIDLLDAFSTSKNKTLRSLSASLVFLPYVGLWSSLWRNTAAISSISIVADAGNSFVTGSRFSLYGIKAA